MDWIPCNISENKYCNFLRRFFHPFSFSYQKARMHSTSATKLIFCLLWNSFLSLFLFLLHRHSSWTNTYPFIQRILYILTTHLFRNWIAWLPFYSFEDENFTNENSYKIWFLNFLLNAFFNTIPRQLKFILFFLFHFHSSMHFICKFRVNFFHHIQTKYHKLFIIRDSPLFRYLKLIDFFSSLPPFSMKKKPYMEI